jgi:hypothetical protein
MGKDRIEVVRHASTTPLSRSWGWKLNSKDIPAMLIYHDVFGMLN